MSEQEFEIKAGCSYAEAHAAVKRHQAEISRAVQDAVRPPTSPAKSWDPEALKRAVARARKFPHNTCPASRHVEQLGVALCRKHPWVLTFHEEPEHCGASMLATVAALYRTRAALRELHTVCVGMDAEIQGERPTEAAYQAAMRRAAKALGVDQ